MLTTDIPKSPRLMALQKERARLRAELTDSVAALDHAKRNLDDWRRQHTTAADSAAAQETTQCARLAALIASDTFPTITPLEPDSAATTQLAHAQLNLSVAQKALTALQSAHQSTRDKLTALEDDIASEAESLLAERREALAAAVQEAWAGFVSAVGALRALTPDHLHTPVNVPRREISPRVAAALALLPPLEDGIHTPLNQLRGQLASAAPLLAARGALIAEEPIA